jgi:hypothetical protein
MSLVKWDLQKELLTLSLNRKEKKNAVNLEMIDELDAHLDRVLATDAIRAVIVRGEDGCFCSGADLQALAGFSGEAMRDFHDRSPDRETAIGRRRLRLGAGGVGLPRWGIHRAGPWGGRGDHRQCTDFRQALQADPPGL